MRFQPGFPRMFPQLRREAPDLAARQVGRARGDLQYRLAEATRALVRGSSNVTPTAPTGSVRPSRPQPAKAHRRTVILVG
jgi:hypothetical protein